MTGHGGLRGHGHGGPQEDALVVPRLLPERPDTARVHRVRALRARGLGAHRGRHAPRHIRLPLRPPRALSGVRRGADPLRHRPGDRGLRAAPGDGLRPLKGRRRLPRRRAREAPALPGGRLRARDGARRPAVPRQAGHGHRREVLRRPAAVQEGRAEGDAGEVL